MAVTGVFILAVDGMDTAKEITGIPVIAADTETAFGLVTFAVTTCC